MCFQFFAAPLFSQIAAGVGAAGTAASVVGQVQQARREESAAQYNAAVLRQNAKLERERALAAEEDLRRKAKQDQARQRVALAASGVDITSGTSLDLIEDMAAEFELDALRTRADGDNRAIGAERSAVSYDASARSARSSLPFSVTETLFDTSQRWAALT